MKTFKTHLSEEKAAGSGGEEMENAISSAFNGEKYTGPYAEAGKKIAATLKSQYKFSGQARSVPKGAPVSAEWEQFWRPEKVPHNTRTPKTDIMIGSKKVSVKMGAAQLMSGGPNESRATFWAATQMLKNGPHHKLAEQTAVLFNNLVDSSVAAGNVETVLKSGKDEKLNKAEEGHKQLMSSLNEMFAQSKDFANAFTYEATTGDIKYSMGDSAADTILAVSPDGNKVVVHPTSDTAYIAKIADQLRIQVRFKSTSVKKTEGGVTSKTGEYRYWSVVSLIVNKLTESYELAMEHLLTEDVNARKYLREATSEAAEQAHAMGLKYYGWGAWGKDGIITHESSPDGTKLNRAEKSYSQNDKMAMLNRGQKHLAGSVSSAAKKVKQKLSDVMSSVKQWIMDLIRRVIHYISQSFQNLLSFLGVEPEVSHGNNANWLIEADSEPFTRDLVASAPTELKHTATGDFDN